MPFKVIIVLNTAWNLVNFRTGLIRALVHTGYEVVTVAPPDNHAPRLAELGCRFVPLSIDNKGTHPGHDLLLLWRLWRLLQRERPAVFLGYTVKPNVYGSLAAHALGIPVINNITGLGAVFINERWLTRLVRGLYRLAMARSHKVFFQNPDDRALFIQGKLVDPAVTELVPGSGIDLTRFSYTPYQQNPVVKGFRFLLIARMLWDKGIGEYVEAARMLKRRYPNVDFCLLGFLDVQNPAAISRSEMDGWVQEGVVRYLGVTDDIRPFIAESDCVVLPSYREGTPRTLLEAAAIGRPIVTTDTVGCREVVDDGENGFLCRVRDADNLAVKMEKMLSLSPETRVVMGKKGRKKMERQFDEKIVIDKYLEAIDQILSDKNSNEMAR